MVTNRHLWLIGRLLTIGALATLAGNALTSGPKLVEVAGLGLAAAGVAATSIAWKRR